MADDEAVEKAVSNTSHRSIMLSKGNASKILKRRGRMINAWKASPATTVRAKLPITHKVSSPTCMIVGVTKETKNTIK